MADSSQYALRYSHYSLNIGGIPREFELSESLRQLSASSIDKHDVSREHEIIAKYEAMMAELVVETNEKEALEKEKQISLQESKVEMQLKPTHHQTPWTTPVVHGGSAALSASSKDLILVEMMNQTHQEKDVCYFYLESANWNINNAIELLQSMVC